MTKRHEKSRAALLFEWLVVGAMVGAFLFFIGGPLLEPVLMAAKNASREDIVKGFMYGTPVFVICMVIAWIAVYFGGGGDGGGGGENEGYDGS